MLKQENQSFTRRDFLKFIGSNLGLLALSSFTLNSCSKYLPKSNTRFKEIEASLRDDVVLPEGFSYELICAWQDPINCSESFGTNNDYIAFFELEKNKALLWVNHEGLDTRFIPDYQEQRKAVGGSVIAIEKINSKWVFSKDKTLQEKYNCRYDANSPVTYSGPAAEILGDYFGTLANCSGGVTPWNTVLTCEENYEHFPDKYHWKDFKEKYYGWVVEIDPYKKNFLPVKHTALGRFAHECATVTLAKNKKLVVYMGDDANDEHVYKYVSEDSYTGQKNSSELLAKGTLYVAQLDKETKSGKWIALDMNNEELRKKFKSQGKLLLQTRKAAKYVAATPLHRPEDIAISPFDNSVFVTQTNHISKGDFHGSILKLMHEDHDALEFVYEDFIEGGKEAGLSNPDNLAFDDKGNLWVTTDIMGLGLHKGVYKYHGNNALFYIPVSGKDAGKPKRFASAPLGAEFTGPCFSPDFKTLFLSVQHPGEHFDSKWNKDSSHPRSAVIAIDL